MGLSGWTAGRRALSGMPVIARGISAVHPALPDSELDRLALGDRPRGKAILLSGLPLRLAEGRKQAVEGASA